jgi:hypothetical protein
MRQHDYIKPSQGDRNLRLTLFREHKQRFEAKYGEIRYCQGDMLLLTINRKRGS